ncbi:hypothetical protein H5407_01375 [Mitsuaria sp. WAJ17]|uniref:hypothetical protein n=1 Tax=Mitsuaria sp. WAJ17 TaxID=2761452 RepID=UPI0015FFE848|nr:hypothetical protein [Mitsuaria sp. WAJ17]MBB2483870.1 hypothetical protein [Mitsuaria sp. WAJ17]
MMVIDRCRRMARRALGLSLTLGLAMPAWSAEWGLLDGRISGGWLRYSQPAQSGQAGTTPQRGHALRLLPQRDGPQAACCWQVRPARPAQPSGELSVPLLASQDEELAQLPGPGLAVQPLAQLDIAALKAPFIGLWTDAPVRVQALGPQQLVMLWPSDGPVLRLRYCLATEGLRIDALDLRSLARTRWYLPLDYAIEAGPLSCQD